jgi:flagellar biosynthesis protein FliQ
MTPELVIQVLRDALLAALWLSLPLLAIGFLAGIVISLFQVLTSIQDSAVGSVPRLLIFLGAILALLPWMLNRSMAYTVGLLSGLDRYAH